MAFYSLIRRYRVDENPLKALRRVELTVLLLVALLLMYGGFVSVSTSISSGAGVIMPAEDSLRIHRLALEQPLEPEQVEQFLSRPLFWAGRRPIERVVVTAPPPKAAAPKKLEGVVLHGVFGAGDSLGVIATIDGKLGRVTMNGEVKGWRLESYENGYAVFRNGSSVQKLPLELTAPSVKIAASSQKPKPQAKKPRANEDMGLTFGGGSSRDD